MGTLLIRNIDDATLVKLSGMAKKRNISREAFIRTQLNDMAIAGELKAVDEKYGSLANFTVKAIQNNTENIEVLKAMIEDISRRI